MTSTAARTNGGTIVDLSGFMFSGKSAVSDVLAEFDRVHVPNYRSEFDLLRMSGGLIDLKHAAFDWSPIRGHGALRRFRRVVGRMMATPSGASRFISTGFGYATQYPNMAAAVDRFIAEITAVSWETPWPYDDLDDGPLATFRRKLRGRRGGQTMRQYELLARDRFIPAAQRLIDELLWQGVARSDVDFLVTHNALEPFDPAANLDLLGADARCIVVDRDPRDIYATAITTQVGFNDNLALYRRIAGAHDLDTFIARQRLYREMCAAPHPRVLRLRFEDLVTEYDATVAAIREFLRLPAANHVRRGQVFDVAKAATNMRMWERPELRGEASAFRRIEEALGGGCEKS